MLGILTLMVGNGSLGNGYGCWVLKTLEMLVVAGSVQAWAGTTEASRLCDERFQETTFLPSVTPEALLSQ